MAKKKTKPTPAIKRQANAKQALKKKQKLATKSENEQLREDLDCQMQAVYLTQQPLSQTKKILSDVVSPQVDSVNDLLTSITKL